MIEKEEEKARLKPTVDSELTLSDFQELEAAVSNELKTAPKIKLLLNLTNMAGFTLDVAWEDIQFTRAHAHDFKRVAVVTSSRWVTWLGWLPAAFTDAEVEQFEDMEAANAWLHGS